MDSRIKTYLSATTLTAAYTDNVFSVNTNGYTDLVLLVSYTTGGGETSNVFTMKAEVFGDDETDLYSVTSLADSSGTITASNSEWEYTGAAAATEYAFSIPIETRDRTIKFSIKEVGVASNYGTLTVKAVPSANYK